MKLNPLRRLAPAAALLLIACDGGASTAPARDHAAAPPPLAATAQAPAKAADGRPIWSSNSRYTAEENALRAFERNGEDFGAEGLDDFVAKAHAFVGSPPKGAETLRRANGDLLIYDPAANVFAVATKDGAPRTMFKPDDGAAYWAEQKQKEAERKG